jgi:hypothetical protein
LALTALCAEFFVVIHLDHDCTGGESSVCRETGPARRLLESLGGAGIIALAAGLVFAPAVPEQRPRLFCPAPLTLVSLKIKFNS